MDLYVYNIYKWLPSSLLPPPKKQELKNLAQSGIFAKSPSEALILLLIKIDHSIAQGELESDLWQPYFFPVGGIARNVSEDRCSRDIAILMWKVLTEEGSRGGALCRGRGQAYVLGLIRMDDLMISQNINTPKT